MLALVLLITASSPYVDSQAALETTRVELTRLKRGDARLAARTAILSWLEQSAFPAWSGTPWDFNGTSTTPGEGKIACGYLVSTVLLHAGFKVERVRLAQQASANIVSTLARGSKVTRFTPRHNADALKQMRAKLSDGLYVVGFDFHVGFLRLDGDTASFCHSSFIAPGSVTCEDPVPSGAFASRLYVVADALNDAVLDDWLAGRAIKTITAR
ncbi:MAG: hypothetical protein ACO1OB_10815 [Archangium sp.]